MTTIIDNTAAIATSLTVTVSDEYAEIVLLAKGLTGTEHCELQIFASDGSWVPVKFQGTNALTASNNSVNIRGRQKFRIYKPETAGPVSVYVLAAPQQYSVN